MGYLYQPRAEGCGIPHTLWRDWDEPATTDTYGGPRASALVRWIRAGGSWRPAHKALDRGAESVPARNPEVGQAGQGSG